MKIHDPHSFQAPGYIGISDNHERLALRTLKTKKVAPRLQYADEVYIYDLVSRQTVFSRTTDQGSVAEALAPEGHAVAILENGVLSVVQVP
jgi:hypothetical protein